VVLAARGEDALDTVADECRTLGGRALAVPADVTDPAAVERVAARAAAEFGRIDAWINNAAVATYGAIDEVPMEEWRRVVEVILFGTAYGTRTALPYLRAAGGGVLVNNASILAEVTMPYISAYNAAKHGVRALSDTVRQELRARGDTEISVCTVLPATIDTPFYRHAANHTGRELTPIPPVYPARVPARTIVRLLRRPRREAYAGSAALAAGLQWRVTPGLGERILGAISARTQFGPSPAPTTSGNLFGESAGDARIDGGWHGRRRSALRATAAVGLAAGTAAGAAVAVTRRRRGWR